MNIINEFKKIKIDLSSVGLCRGKFVNYFCTPLGAVIFANLGVDGIHFCIIPSKNDETLENSPIYVVNPCMSEHYVEPIAENFFDFLSLVVITKDAGAMECISYMTRESFNDYLKDIPEDREEIVEAIEALKEKFSLREIPDVYDYVKGIQKNDIFRKVKFSQEYYEGVGEGGDF